MNSLITFSLLIIALFSTVYGVNIHPEFRDIVHTNVQASEFVFLNSSDNNGLAVFCDSVDMLSKISHLLKKEITITFLSTGVEGGEYVAKRSSKWPFTVKMIELGREETLNYLKASARVAVIPSVSDNAPNSVFECMYAGIPFLTSNFPSISPFFASDASRAAHTFEVKPHNIASKMLSAARDGLSTAVPSFTISQAESVWTALYAKVQPSSVSVEGSRYVAHTTISALSA